jgi:hypothetical protein
MIFAYQPQSPVGGTVPTWQDHKPAPGCKPFLKTTAGPELSYYHIGLAFAQGPGVTFSGTPITGPGKMTLNSDLKAYYLDKDLVIPPQCTLVVAPGNWIYGGTYSKLDTNAATINNSNAYGGSIIIMEGAIGHLVGTKDSTVVLTGYGDDFRDLACFGPGVKGMWGGLIIKGNAPVSNGGWHSTYPTMEGVAQYEGSAMASFGHGSDPNDNSGEYQYLSVRHGGAGRATNSEINGIGLYGVGRGTHMDHIEVMSNYDDAIEYFGGTVDMKYVCNSFCDDDQFDIDQGYSGRMQYLFSVELNWMGNRSGEWDGKKHYDDPNPTANPTICNLTQIGCGKYTSNIVDTGALEDQNYGARYLWQLADSLMGDYRNVIGMDQAKYAFWMRNHDLLPANGPDGNNPGQAPIGTARGPKWSGLMVYHTNYRTANDNAEIWANLVEDDNGQAAISVASLNAPGNKCFCNVDPMLRGVSREFKFAALDPRPCVNSPALTPAVYVANPSDGFFDQTAYCGAFNSTDLWCDGWTKLSQMGCLTQLMTTFPENAVVTSNANFDFAYGLTGDLSGLNALSITINDIDWTGVLAGFIAVSGSNCGGAVVKMPLSAPIVAILGSSGAPGTVGNLGAINPPVYNYQGLYTMKFTLGFDQNLYPGKKPWVGVSRLKIGD